MEDNRDLRDLLLLRLNVDDIELITFEDAPALYEHLNHSKCDIVILDIGLPGEDGLSIAAHLRKSYGYQMGIIMLTGNANIESRLNGFIQGADIYLVKPVDWRVLKAQIKALERRLGLATNDESNKQQTLKRNKPTACWLLRENGRELVLPSGFVMNLTQMEAQIVKKLATEAGQVVRRQELIEVLEPRESSAYSYDPRRLEVCISRLRKKIINQWNDSITEPLDTANLPLKTVRGKGYIFTQTIDIQVN